MIKRALNENDWALVTKYALAGAGLGGGAALLTSLVHYIKNMNRRYEEESSDHDDSTLYLRVKPAEKQAAVNDKQQSPDRNIFVSGPLSITAGALAAMGGWALVNSLYKQVLLNEAQEELDEAQNQYINANGYERVKKAEVSERSQSMGLGSNVLSFLLSVPGLFAIASGVVAYNALNKYFPDKKVPVTSPRKIKIITSDSKLAGDTMGPDYNTQGSDSIKMASCVEPSDGVEFLIRSVVTSNMPDSNIANIVSDVASCGNKGFEKLASTIGFDNALCAVKGQENNYNNNLTEQLAITHLAKSASIGSQIAITAAAEFAEMFPTIFTTASALPEDHKEFFEKIACALGKATRSFIISRELGIDDYTLEKKASMLADDNTVLSVLNKLNSLNDSESNSESEDRTETSKEEAGIKNKPKYVASSKTGLRLAKAIEDMDDIDKILNPDSKS